jgi:hypothetical protein
LDVYYKATRYIANTLCDTINKYLIPQLVGMNFARGKNPCLRVRRIGEEEALRTLSFAFRNFVGAGAIRPDDPLEKFLRSELDLPPADPKTSRTTPDPQLATGAGQEAQLTGSAKDPNVAKAQQAQGPSGATNASPGKAPNAPGTPTTPRVGPPRQSTTPPVHAGKRNTGRDASGG